MALGGDFHPYLGCQTECQIASNNPSKIARNIRGSFAGTLGSKVSRLPCRFVSKFPGSLACHLGSKLPGSLPCNISSKKPSKIARNIRGSFAGNLGSKTSRLPCHFGTKLPGPLPCHLGSKPETQPIGQSYKVPPSTKDALPWADRVWGKPACFCWQFGSQNFQAPWLPSSRQAGPNIARDIRGSFAGNLGPKTSRHLCSHVAPNIRGIFAGWFGPKLPGTSKPTFAPKSRR